jgi:hypothetical protein
MTRKDGTMSIRMFAVLALVFASLFALPRAEAGTTHQVVRGRMVAAQVGGSESGRFRIAVVDRSNGAHVERIEAFAKHLDLSGFSATNPPAFHVWLTLSDGTGAADFGLMRVNRHGNGVFIFDTHFASLPSGVATIEDFGGGTIEVKSGTTSVLTAGIPSFTDLGGGGGTGGSAAFGHASERLQPVDSTSHARGEITARRQDAPGGEFEELFVRVSALGNATTYDVVAIASDTTETALGSFTTSDPLGLGGFRLATRDGDTIPGGGVLTLAGQAVEVRDASGAAVLTGTFPTIQ